MLKIRPLHRVQRMTTMNYDIYNRLPAASVYVYLPSREPTRKNCVTIVNVHKHCNTLSARYSCRRKRSRHSRCSLDAMNVSRNSKRFTHNLRKNKRRGEGGKREREASSFFINIHEDRETGSLTAEKFPRRDSFSWSDASLESS